MNIKRQLFAHLHLYYFYQLANVSTFMKKETQVTDEESLKSLAGMWGFTLSKTESQPAGCVLSMTSGQEQDSRWDRRGVKMFFWCGTKVTLLLFITLGSLVTMATKSFSAQHVGVLNNAAFRGRSEISPLMRRRNISQQSFLTLHMNGASVVTLYGCDGGTFGLITLVYTIKTYCL